jgi:hypothetical protein
MLRPIKSKSAHLIMVVMHIQTDFQLLPVPACFSGFCEHVPEAKGHHILR